MDSLYIDLQQAQLLEGPYPDRIIMPDWSGESTLFIHDKDYPRILVSYDHYSLLHPNELNKENWI